MKNNKKTHIILNPETRNPNQENSFAFRLTYALKTRKLLAVDLTDPTGFGKSTISLYVNGKSMPNRERIIILANALRVDPAWLAGYTPLTAINRYCDDDPYLDEELEKIKDIWLGLNAEGKNHLIKTAMLLFDSPYFKRSSKNTK